MLHVPLRREGLLELEVGYLGVFVYVEAVDQELHVFRGDFEAVLEHQIFDLRGTKKDWYRDFTVLDTYIGGGDMTSKVLIKRSKC